MGHNPPVTDLSHGCHHLYLIYKLGVERASCVYLADMEFEVQALAAKEGHKVYFEESSLGSIPAVR